MKFPATNTNTYYLVKESNFIIANPMITPTNEIKFTNPLQSML